MDKQLQTELEAAAFRQLLDHFRKHTEVQNIDLMTLGGFCRNCLSKWYRSAALERGVEMSDEVARESIYGMPYSKWKTEFQPRATDEQMVAFEKSKKYFAAD